MAMHVFRVQESRNLPASKYHDHSKHLNMSQPVISQGIRHNDAQAPFEVHSAGSSINLTTLPSVQSLFSADWHTPDATAVVGGAPASYVCRPTSQKTLPLERNHTSSNCPSQSLPDLARQTGSLGSATIPDPGLTSHLKSQLPVQNETTQTFSSMASAFGCPAEARSSITTSSSPVGERTTSCDLASHATPPASSTSGIDETARSPSEFGLDIEVPLTGRLSDEALRTLTEGFGELDAIIRKIKGSTGLCTKQILKRWLPAKPKHLNYWNIYQKYFYIRIEEEMRRLPEDERPQSNKNVSMDAIRAAYRSFQENEPNHESILATFWRIMKIDDSNTTFNTRHREFLKFVNTLKRQAEAASTINGFEVAFCAVGGVVQQDQSLSTTYCTQMVPNFFSNRLHITDNELEGHLKAHAYDQASRLALSSSCNGNGPAMTTVAGNSAAEHDHLKEDRAPTKKEVGSRKLLLTLKGRIKDLLGPCNIAKFKQIQLPFSAIPAILAENGWVLENWPEDVPFPCDLQQGKGIAGLKACYRGPLLKALDDQDYPIKVVKRYSEAVPPSEPIIIGVPPPPGSAHTHGRRRFLGDIQSVDRNGPSRRVGQFSGHASALPLTRKKKLFEFSDEEGMDGERSRKRRKEE